MKVYWEAANQRLFKKGHKINTGIFTEKMQTFCEYSRCARALTSRHAKKFYLGDMYRKVLYNYMILGMFY